MLALTLWSVVRLLGMTQSPWQILLWCVVLIPITDPLAVLSNSLWLSCSAVAALIFSSSGRCLHPLPQGWLTLPCQVLALSVVGCLGIIIWRFSWWRCYSLTLSVATNVKLTHSG